MNIRNKEYLELLKQSYNEKKFIEFIKDLLNLDPTDINNNINAITRIPNQYKESISNYKYIAKYNDGLNDIGIFSIKLNEKSSTKARSKQRNFIATLLSRYNLDASIVSFYSDKETSWRLSFVKKELSFGKKGFKEVLTPAKRYSYLVGEHESVHTAQEFLLKLLQIDSRKITLDDIESVFDVEKVTKRFFEEYKDKYLSLKDYLDENEDFITESQNCDFKSAEFAKKLMGQIVFLYFLQKKGWLGVQLIPNQLTVEEYEDLLNKNDSVSNNLIKLFYELKDDLYMIDKNKLRSAETQDINNFSNIFVGTDYDKDWGSGDKDFIRSIYKQAIREDKNFFDSYLEQFFYKGLNEKRDNQYFPLFNCKIPFLNGGLFEPLNNYRWSSSHFSIPNEMFSNDEKKGILDFLDLYNFTIDEEEPLEKEIAVDPEMLGKIFENLLEVDDRKSKGAFYTPREIVYYMCQESLANYLVNKVGVDYNEIIEFIKYGDLISQLDWELSLEENTSHQLGDTIFENIVEIDKALMNVKIADPAVGSGAFPLGMLIEIVKLRNNLTTYMLIQQELGKIDLDSVINSEQRKREIFDMKLQTIENCIYAVDRETSAIDITKLRLWLSLIVDYPNNEEPKPLPNLDCKIMQGNSLIDEFENIPLFDSKMLDNHLKKYKRSKSKNKNIKKIEIQYSLNNEEVFELQMKQFIKYQREYFITSDSQKKKELKSKMEKIQCDIIKKALEKEPEKLEKFEEEAKKRQKTWFIWKFEFYDVFKDNGGFDIIIGNPPYAAELTDEEKKYLLKKFPSVADYETANYFIAMSKLICKENALLSFIIPNMFMANVNAKKFRNYLLDNWYIKQIDNFSESSIFESASVRNCIIYLINDNHKRKNKTSITKMNFSSKLSLEKKRELTELEMSEKIINWLNILEETEEVLKIVKKIQKDTTPLENLCDISQGLIPYDKYRGHTEYQIKNKVWNSNFQKDETYKKELRGQDIKRYSLEWNGKDWISYGPWLAAPRKIEYFTQKRILIREITNPRIFATISEEEFYNTPSIINCINFKDEYIYYILGLLNSKLFTFYHIKSSPKSNKGLFPKILVSDVHKIPIKIPNSNIIKLMEDLVKANLEKYDIKNDYEIDKLVYDIYNISKEEIEIIEAEID